MMKLHPRSKQYIEEILKPYDEVDELPEIIEGQVIIHMYPVEDTMQEELEGYIDALFCDVHIYMPETMTVYKCKRKDAVNVGCPSTTKVFKDGSTLVSVNGEKLVVEAYQAIRVERIA